MSRQPLKNSAEFIRLLKASGWSQARAARALEITPGAVSQICSRRTRPRSSTLGLLKRVIGTGAGTAARGRWPEDEPALDPSEVKLIANFRRLPPSERRAVALIVRRMGVIGGGPNPKHQAPTSREFSSTRL